MTQGILARSRSQAGAPVFRSWQPASREEVNRVENREKQVYETPELIEHGELEKLTAV